jgi:hypothetical protein
VTDQERDVIKSATKGGGRSERGLGGSLGREEGRRFLGRKRGFYFGSWRRLLVSRR